MQAKGEVAALADTINDMTATLAIFADQVTTVAREVGVEGRLGGQANVPGAAGTWKDLTGNVNLLAANLTTQVRAIAEVATAVTQGDLTRSIQVEARGEVAELKDNINTMIDNLRLTTDRNTEQDWLKTNLARFTGMLQGQRDLATVGRMLLSELTPLVNAHQGVIYRTDRSQDADLRLVATFADDGEHGHRAVAAARRRLARAVRGRQAAHGDQRPARTPRRPSVPACFSAAPRSVIVLPVLFEGEVKAVIELASLGNFTASHLAFLEQLTANIGIVLNSIEATMQTEGLLQAVAAARRGTADPAERAAADQRAAGAEGAAARRAERRGRAQEPGNRAGAPRARGKSDRARAHVEVQVRVPGEHVARAAHAAQQHPDPGPAARRQLRRQSAPPSRSSSRARFMAPAPTC